MSLRDRAEVTEWIFSEDGSRWTAVDGRWSTDGGRRTVVDRAYNKKHIISYLTQTLSNMHNVQR